MVDDVLEWMRASRGPWPYVVLGLAALIEYVFPPFPGDTITLFGVFLTVTAGYRVIWVYLALNLGSVVGGLAAYGAGRYIGARSASRRPRFLRSQQARQAIAAVLRRFERHGAAYLALNRFVPVLRAFFFVAAGMARMSVWKVAFYGALSAAAWNAILLGVGWFIGDQWELLRSLVEGYGLVVGGALVFAALIWWLLRWRRKRRAPVIEAADSSEGASTEEP